MGHLFISVQNIDHNTDPVSSGFNHMGKAIPLKEDQTGSQGKCKMKEVTNWD